MFAGDSSFALKLWKAFDFPPKRYWFFIQNVLANLGATIIYAWSENLIFCPVKTSIKKILQQCECEMNNAVIKSC